MTLLLKVFMGQGIVISYSKVLINHDNRMFELQRENFHPHLYYSIAYKNKQNYTKEKYL